MQNAAGPQSSARGSTKKGVLPLPAAPLYPFTVANLHEVYSDLAVKPHHGDCMAVGEYPRLGVHVPKLVSHFCVPLSFLSVYSIA